MVIPLEKDGSIKIENYPFLGSWFSLADRLQGKGLGSIKLHYIKGIPQFDELHQLNVDTAFVNFEPTTKGLIIRFNKSNRIRAYGIANDDIKNINIKVQKLEVKNILTRKITKKSKGLLSIEDEINTVCLAIPVNQVDKMIVYFKYLELHKKLKVVNEPDI